MDLFNFPGFNPSLTVAVFVSILAFAMSLVLYTFQGVALWRSAIAGDIRWFVAIFALQLIHPFLALISLTLALLYLFKYAEHKLTMDQIKSWKKYLSKSTAKTSKKVKKAKK